MKIELNSIDSQESTVMPGAILQFVLLRTEHFELSQPARMAEVERPLSEGLVAESRQTSGSIDVTSLALHASPTACDCDSHRWNNTSNTSITL